MHNEKARKTHKGRRACTSCLFLLEHADTNSSSITHCRGCTERQTQSPHPNTHTHTHTHTQTYTQTHTQHLLTQWLDNTVDRSSIKLNSECLGSLFQMKQIKVISRRRARWRNPESALIPADVAESHSVLAQHSLGRICHYVKLPRPAPCCYQ